MVGFLYLWGYWSSFGLNILEYLNLTDILKLSLFPVLSFFVSMVIGAIVGSLIASEKQLPLGGGVNTLLSQFLYRHRQPLSFGYWFVVVLIYSYGPIEKWWILPVLICIPLGAYIRQTGILKDLVPSGVAELATVSILCYVPFGAYGHGITNANEIMQGQNYQYVELSPEQLQTQPHAKEKEDNLIKLKYLGFVNDYVFLMPMEDKSIIVTRFDKLGTLKIKSSAKR